LKKNNNERYRHNGEALISSFSKQLKRNTKDYNRYKAPLGEKVGNANIINAPKQVSIYDFGKQGSCVFTETIEFIDNVKKSISKGNCIIDFSQTERFTAAAMVMFFSQIQQAYDNSSFILKIGSSRQSSAVNKILRRSGLRKLAESKEMILDFDSLRQLPVIKGVGYKKGDEIVDYIQEKIYNNKMSPETEYRIGDAVSETMNNVGRHAYPETDKQDRHWWLLCEVVGNQLYLAIYDNGVGIPKTVVEKTWFLSSFEISFPDTFAEIKEKVGALADKVQILSLNTLKDAELISMSMKGDVTGTKQMKHGQGSKSIKALVNDTKGGKLWVYSNKGLYRFEPNDVEPQMSPLPKSIKGTLIQWNIEIQ
jgi:hypothetical protein